MKWRLLKWFDSNVILIRYIKNLSVGATGEIPHERDSSTDWSLAKDDTDSSELDSLRQTLTDDMDEKLKKFHLLVNSTKGDEDEDQEDFTDYDYTFY